MSAVEALEAVSVIVAAFPVPAWPKETVRLYADCLADCPAQPLKAAALEWVKTQATRPTIAELRTAAGNMGKRIAAQRRKRQLARVTSPEPAVLEPADPVEVRKLLTEMRQKLEGRSLALVGADPQRISPQPREKASVSATATAPRVTP